MNVRDLYRNLLKEKLPWIFQLDFSEFVSSLTPVEWDVKRLKSKLGQRYFNC